MSIEDLQADIDRNTADLDARVILTTEDVKAILKDTIFPLFKAVANEMEEIDDDLSDMVEHAESILQEEDAQLFAQVIKDAVHFAEALTKRLKQTDNDNKWRSRIAKFSETVQLASARLVQITVVPGDDDEDEDEPDQDGPDDAPGKPTLTSVPANDQGAQ